MDVSIGAESCGLWLLILEKSMLLEWSKAKPLQWDTPPFPTDQRRAEREYMGSIYSMIADTWGWRKRSKKLGRFADLRVVLLATKEYPNTF
jgi:hypothetical protein